MNDSVFAHLLAASPSENKSRGVAVTGGFGGAMGASVSTFCTVVSVMASSLRDARGEQLGEIRWDRTTRRRALRPRPDRIRKVAVVLEARNHVPVQVRHEIAKARKVHLVRIKQRANGGLDAKHDAHQMCAVDTREVGHLAHMRVPNDTTKAGKRLVGDHDTAASVVVHLLAPLSAAKHTGPPPSAHHPH